MVDKIQSAPAWEFFPRKVPQSFRRSMKICKDYYIAKDVVDAVETLAKARGSAKVIAGGTDLLLDIQQARIAPPATLVDVTEIPEMQKLEIRNNELFIGASVPHNRIVRSDLVRKHAEALAEACGLIGGPQVRNVASLGGNVGHALPAADGTISLVALDARVEIANPEGLRSEPLIKIFKGPGENNLAKDEIITGFYIPLGRKNQASAFKRIMRPQGVAIAILNCAVWIDLDGDKIRDIRISIGPSGPVPKRMVFTEDRLRGEIISRGIIDLANQTMLNEANFRTSRHRATLEYRKMVAAVLLKDCVETCWQRTNFEVITNGYQ